MKSTVEEVIKRFTGGLKTNQAVLFKVRSPEHCEAYPIKYVTAQEGQPVHASTIDGETEILRAGTSSLLGIARVGDFVMVNNQILKRVKGGWKPATDEDASVLIAASLSL